jgi:DNA replication protein DnaC
MAAFLDSIDDLRIAAQAAAHNHRVTLLQEDAGVPARYADSSFSNFNSTKQLAPIIKSVTDYCNELGQHFTDGRGIYMKGNAGSGKTHLAAAVLRFAMEKFPKRTYMFGPLSYTLFRLKRTFEKEGPCNDRDIIDKMVNADLAVIDDLGKEQDTPWVRSMAYTVINERYNDRRPTIYTTNDEYSDLAKRYEEATMSRIVGSCIGLDFSDVGDYRHVQATKNK